jgi:hypothetical protein
MKQLKEVQSIYVCNSTSGVGIGRGHTLVKILFRLRFQKLYPQHMSKTICKGTDHGLTSKMNVYTEFNKKYIFQKIKIFISKIYLKNTG